MRIPFTRWPDEFARRYREKGYWQDVPLTDILTRHADSDKTAVIEGERAFSYRQLNQAADNLACSLRRQGIKPGETALVQLGECTGTVYHLFRPVEAWRSARSGAV
ncbi:enterobactin synthase subunit E [Salmonella enterica]|nr:enterobactin synthase subunit E [Salmonella enterica]